MSLNDEEIYEAISEILPKLGAETSSTVLGAGSDDLEAGRNYLQVLVEEGWMLPTWPQKYGGRNSTPEEASQISKTLGLFEGADLYPYGVGLSLVGPVLMELGTDDQMNRWLPAKSSIPQGGDPKYDSDRWKIPCNHQFSEFRFHQISHFHQKVRMK